MIRIAILLSVVLAASACGGGGSPVGPSPDQGRFLAGTWTGTLTVHRAGVPDVSGPTTWTFEPVANTAGFSYRAQIRTQHPWLPAQATGTTDLVPPGAPPSDVSTLGAYSSPRGCTGTFSSQGTADEHHVTASFVGVDCNLTFEGFVSLSR